MWTQFWDMHSGGGLKEAVQFIYIEAPQEEAEVIFYNKFGHNPNRVTCTCCGEDYTIEEGEDLAQLTAWHRGCRHDKNTNKYVEEHGNDILSNHTSYRTLEQYMQATDECMFIFAKDIKPEEREGELPQQGWCWVD